MKKIILVFAIILEQIGITIPSNWVSVNPYQANTNTVSPAASYLDEISPLPQKIQETDANIQARSFILIDRNTSKVMAEKESNIRIPMASLTKIMAATIVLEKAKLEDKVNRGKKVNFVIISTYQSFTNKDFQQILPLLPESMILIADEAHNIGSELVRSVFRGLHIKKRIALSATPNRIYDEEGTAELEGFFNDNPPYIYNFPMS